MNCTQFGDHVLLGWMEADVPSYLSYNVEEGEILCVFRSMAEAGKFYGWWRLQIPGEGWGAVLPASEELEGVLSTSIWSRSAHSPFRGRRSTCFRWKTSCVRSEIPAGRGTESSFRRQISTVWRMYPHVILERLRVADQSDGVPEEGAACKEERIVCTGIEPAWYTLWRIRPGVQYGTGHRPDEQRM